MYIFKHYKNCCYSETGTSWSRVMRRRALNPAGFIDLLTGKDLIDMYNIA